MTCQCFKINWKIRKDRYENDGGQQKKNPKSGAILSASKSSREASLLLTPLVECNKQEGKLRCAFLIITATRSSESTMTDPQPASAPPAEKINWRLISRGILLVLLLGLCGFGLAATPFWKQHTLDYWLWMVPCFGVLSILLCLLSESQRHSMQRWRVLRLQALQWIGTGAAIYLVFWLIKQNFLNVEAAGPTVTIIIALSIYLAGITFDWLLVLIALLLAAMAVGAVYLEKVMLLVAGSAVILVIAFLLLRSVIRNYRRPHAPQKPPAPAPASGEVSSELA
jgi:hypothetical protein